MKNKVLLFGMLADAIGCSVIELEGGGDTEALKENIIGLYPVLDKYPFVIALNKKVVKGKQLITAGDELALLPPFAGG
ncbi:MAG: MoaD/ThiS family protein [Saprospiraceae bacterium]